MKKIITVISSIAMLAAMTGCNKQIIDTTYKIDYAMVKLANGEVVEGKLDSWLDFENSDMIQVKIDGKTYIVHSSNASLIDE